MELQLATFGAGCFWGVQKTFDQVTGVKESLVGYEGGHLANPTYEQVCAHHSGHTEVVELKFDPKDVSYPELLKTFFNLHDPTQLNRQGPDIGDQYRSVIFFHSPEQKAAAEKFKADLQKSGDYQQEIVTAIEAAQPFYVAEDYHQKYLEQRGVNVCH